MAILPYLLEILQLVIAFCLPSTKYFNFQDCWIVTCLWWVNNIDHPVQLRNNLTAQQKITLTWGAGVFLNAFSEKSQHCHSTKSSLSAKIALHLMKIPVCSSYLILWEKEGGGCWREMPSNNKAGQLRGETPVGLCPIYELINFSQFLWRGRGRDQTLEQAK